MRLHRQELEEAWQTHTVYLAKLSSQCPTGQSHQFCAATLFFLAVPGSTAAHRFLDHRRLVPATCGLNVSSSRGTLTRTKTTGKDDKVQSGVLHVSGNASLVDPKWAGEGWMLSQQFAQWDRDYFSPVPVVHWITSKVQVQVFGSRDSLANTRHRTDHQNGTLFVRQRAW